MNNIGDQINSVINNLASKLGVTVDKIYPVLIKQSYVDGIIDILFIIIGLILCYIPYKVYKYVSTEDKNGKKLCENWNDAWTGYWIISVIVIIIGFFMLCTSLYDLPTCFFNPEFHAIEKILSYINK